MKGERRFESGSGDGLVTHLRSKKREPSKKRRIPRRSESSVNELEEDNYIPEVKFIDNSFNLTQYRSGFTNLDDILLSASGYVSVCF